MLKVFLDIVFHWKWFNEISDNNKKKQHYLNNTIMTVSKDHNSK